MELVANEQQTYTCSMDMTLETSSGKETRSNCDMGLMDLDGALKTYAYKTVTHGNVKVACVDWEKTTEDARNRKKAQSVSAQTATLGKAHYLTTAEYDGLVYICANIWVRYEELKSKPMACVAKMGTSEMLGVPGDTRRGLIRREENGEESLWMEKTDYREFMIGYIASRPQCLQGWQEKSSCEIKSYFRTLQDYQIRECYDGLVDNN
jgi:hypothetical protein